MSRIGYSPTGISGFGNAVVYGFNRVPLPPARMTTGVCSQSMDMGDGLFINLIPFDGLFECFTERILWRPAQLQRSFAGVCDQPVNFARRRAHAIHALAYKQFNPKNSGNRFDYFCDAMLFTRAEIEDFS